MLSLSLSLSLSLHPVVCKSRRSIKIADVLCKYSRTVFAQTPDRDRCRIAHICTRCVIERRLGKYTSSARRSFGLCLGVCSARDSSDLAPHVCGCAFTSGQLYLSMAVSQNTNMRTRLTWTHQHRLRLHINSQHPGGRGDFIFAFSF